MNVQQQSRWRDDEPENIPPGQAAPEKPTAEEDEGDDENPKSVQWWVRNFWSAYDALNEYVLYALVDRMLLDTYYVSNLNQHLTSS